MGQVEDKVRKRAKKKNIQRAILSAVGIAGILAVGTVAPNAMAMLAATPLGKRKALYRANDAHRRLVDRGEIRWVERNGKKFAELTPKGRIRLSRLTLGEIGTRMKKKWDKRWRIVIFDIPEKYRPSRDHLRGMLIVIGFHRLQDSVWVYPHDCEDLIMLLKTDASIGRNALYIVSEQIEGDNHLRKHFELPTED